MGTKSTNNYSSNGKSSAWLFSWFSQLTKSNREESSTILPWKKDYMKSTASSSVLSTAPINVPCSDYSSSYDGGSTIRRQLVESALRPSITISLSPSERRNSQQTTCSSIHTAESQFSYRRDSNSDRSVLSELWSKAKRRHPHYPRFHWPQHRDETQQQQLIPDESSSFRNHHHFPRHLKRHSISSSLATNDHTPFGSRPNSIMSQPASPKINASYLNNENVDYYWLNRQPSERLRWDIKHELTKLAIDGLFCNPDLVTQQKTIEKQVLQIGSGDSSWAIDIATQYARWNVIGLHDDCITTRTSNSLRNFKFMQCDNLIQGLSGFPNGSFDYIASRFLLLSYTFQQYSTLVTECIRVAKPGAFIEVVEMDLRIYYQRVLSCSVTQSLNNEVIKVIESKGLDPRLARNLQDLIVQDMQSEVKYVSLPLGVWGGKLGVMFRDDVHTLIETFQKDVAEFREKQERTDDELEYKVDLMDSEIDFNRAFMNLHLMLIHVP